VQEIAPAEQYVVTEQDLVQKHGDELTRVLGELDAEIEADRIRQIYTALRNILYWQGNQYVVPKFNAADGTFDVVGVAESKDKQMFRSVYNVFEADGLGFIGAVAPRAPNPIAKPDNPEAEDQEQMARAANGLLRYYWQLWDANAKQKTLAYHGWTTGPSFGYTYYNSDKHKYGATRQPKIELMPAEVGVADVPVPTVNGFEEHPNGEVELKILNLLYVTMPYGTSELGDAPWLDYECLDMPAILLDLYGEELEKEVQDNADGDSAAKQAALQAQQATYSPSAKGESSWKQHQWRHSRRWVRPVIYSLIKDKALRNALREQFADGLMIARVNGKVVRVRHERMDDYWAVCKTGKGEHIFESSWGNSTIPIQDNINRLGNMGLEIVLRTIVKTLIDSSLIDREKLRDEDNNMAEILFVDTKGGGLELRKMMAEMPQSKMPDNLVQFFELFRNLARQINGVTEALAGNGAPAETYRAEKQRRDQAMMRFVPFIEEAKRFWEQVGRNAVRLKARYGVGDQRIAAKDGEATEIVDLATLTETGWHVEVEEGIPVSAAEETDRIMGLIQETQPDVPEKLGFWRTESLPVMYRMLGVTGVTPGGENERRKFQSVLKTLLAEPPIQDVDPVTGEPLGAVPTVQPDDVDTFDMMAELARQWCISPAGVKAQRENKDGWDNVDAYFKAQKSRADELAMQSAPMPEGEAPPLGQEAPPAPASAEPQPFDTAPQLPA
jgi:hypothetical protein